ncbi:MAG: TonB-dependent receptor [Candidatus Neomarinimicrobiota bacterium]
MLTKVKSRLLSERKYFFTILTYLVLFSTVFCDSYEVSGHIYDSMTYKPISGANIIIANIGTTSNEFGKFNISINKQSQIKIIMIGYESETIDFTTENVDIYLNPKVLKGIPVEVSATRVIPGITPVAHSNLTSRDVAAHYSVEDVPMILSTEPGIHAYSESGNGTGYSYVSIRGFDQSRIAVMLDNVPLNDNESHQVYWVDHGDILSDASDVEIQRGIGNSLYGAAAFGGSINVQTKIASPIEKLTVGGLMGSFNTYKGRIQYSSGDRFGKRWSLATRLSSIKSDGYRDYSKSNQTAFSVGVEHRTAKMTNQFRALLGKEISQLQWDGISKDMLADRKLRIGAMDWTVPFIDDFYQQIYSLNTRYNLSTHITFRNVAYLVMGSGFYEVEKFGKDYYSYNLDISNELTDEQELAMEADFLRRKWIQNKYYGVVPTMIINYNNWRMNLGFESRIYSGKHFGEVLDVYDPVLRAKLPEKYRYYEYLGEKNSLTAFGHIVYSLRIGLHLVGDVQLQKHDWLLDQKVIGHANGYDLNASWSFTNPRFGFSYAISNAISIFGNYGTAEKEPSDNQIIEADDVWAEPKETASEKIIDEEAGINLLYRDKYLKLNIYRIEYFNEILSDIYDFTEGEFDVKSADKTRHEGIEIEGGWEISNSLAIRFNGAWSFNKFKSGDFNGKSLANVPDQLANVTIDYTPKNIYGFMFYGKYVGKQYIDDTNTQDLAIDPYLIINLNAWLQIDQIRVTARVNNLFDTLYATYGYSYYGGYYWPGATRNFSLAVDVQI